MKKVNIILIILIACMALTSFTMLLIENYHTQNDTLILAVPQVDPNNTSEAKNYEYLEKCIARFEELNSGISIRIKKVEADQYSEWLSTSLLYADAPDIFAVLPTNFYMLSSMNALEDLSVLRLDQFIPQNLTQPWNKEGRQYAIPYQTSPPCIILNRNLIRDKYVKLTATQFDWTDLFYMSKFFTYDSDKDGRNDNFGVTNISWQSLVYANGQKLFDFENKEAFFNNHNVEFAIKYAIEMNRLNLTNVISSFEQGRAVMKATNFTQAMYYIQHYSHLDLEIFPFPKGPDGNFAAEPYDTPLAINTKSKNKDLALDFMTFLVLDYDNQVSMFKDSFSFPVLEEAQNSEEILTALDPYVNDEVLQKIINSETIPIDFHQYYQLMNIADKEIFQYVKYELDIESELEALNETIANELKAIG